MSELVTVNYGYKGLSYITTLILNLSYSISLGDRLVTRGKGVVYMCDIYKDWKLPHPSHNQGRMGWVSVSDSLVHEHHPVLQNLRTDERTQRPDWIVLILRIKRLNGFTEDTDRENKVGGTGNIRGSTVSGRNVGVPSQRLVV